MRVEEMLADVNVTRSTAPAGLDLAGVTCDSREVRPGFAFVALKGERFDGLDFAGEAVAAGARAVVVGAGRFDEASRRLEDAWKARGSSRKGPAAGIVEVEDEREALALLGRNARGRPDLSIRVTGITGTNGKTTTAWLLAAMFGAGGVPCGLMGTVEYRFGALRREAVRTTPEGPEIHDWLARMRDAGAGACAMEVSSHSLDLRRVAGIRFSAAVWTNLTRDHLDYHGDMERYYAAKKRLFDELDPGRPAIVNADDPWGRRLAGERRGRTLLYGRNEEAAFRMIGCETGVEGTTITVEEPGDGPFPGGPGRIEIRSPLVGTPNAYNVLAAAAAARAQGISREAVREGAASVGVVPGRLERVDAGQPFAVLVDYAHTDDALRNVLEVLRPLTAGRLICVFGCGGDRDRSKRPLMGAHAARLSDLFWVTSDNPRGEDPAAIIGMILEGVKEVPGGPERCRVEAERAAAIASAVAEARSGDTVLIAGKGHERVQVALGRSTPFDDVEVARRALGGPRAGSRGKDEDGGGEPA